MPRKAKKKPKDMLKEADGFKYDPMPKKERVLRLERLYDDAIAWLEESVATKKSSGTGAATLVLERMRLEIKELKRTGQESSEKIELTFQCGCCKDKE